MTVKSEKLLRFFIFVKNNYSYLIFGSLVIAMISFGIRAALSIAIGFIFQSLTAIGFHRILSRRKNKFNRTQSKISVN
ncbi:MAG: hypothetical protein ACP6IY_16320 [Promethearchaeia archaeon]